MVGDDRLVRHPGPRGTSFSLGGRRLSGSDPRRSQELRLRFPGFEPHAQTLYCLFSPLLGYGIRDFLASIDETSAILIVELDPRIRELLGDPESEIPNSPRVLVAGNAHQALQHAARAIGVHGIRRIRSIAMSGGVHALSERYTALERTIEESIQRFWLNRATELRFNHRWITNILRNTILEANPIADLAARLKPAVLVVGAGPGLDDNLEWIAETVGLRKRNKAFSIIAIDTALGTLAEGGIAPDIIWSMDAQLVNARDFVPWRWDDIAVVADLSAHPSILRRASPANRFVFATRFADITLFKEPQLSGLFDRVDMLEPRGSVAPSIVEFLSRFTPTERVVSVGVEFWYRKPQTHSRGSTVDRTFRREMTRLRRRDGLDEVELRPTQTVVLDSGESAVGDRILSDHAAQIRSLLNANDRNDIEWTRLAAPGLSTGMRPISGDEARELLVQPAAKNTARSTSPSRHTGAADEVAGSRAKRVAALESLLARLKAQERILERSTIEEAHRCHWDSGLDFVLHDLPQWPVMMLHREWFALQAARILPVVRDYRRRTQRIIRVAQNNGL